MTDKTLPHWLTVSDLASHGIQADEIANYLGISRKELLEDYGDLIRKGTTDRTLEVAKVMYMAALAGSVTAMQAWLKTHGQWDELAKKKPEIKDENVFRAININVIPNKKVEDE